MTLLRIRAVLPLRDFKLSLTLTDGSTVERDVSHPLVGPVFEKIRSDGNVFDQVRVENGTVLWPNGADLCPDVLIRGGAPPEEDKQSHPPQQA